MQNLVAGYDPTGSSSISGANLKALIDAATPYTDKGFTIVTADTAGVPSVPDAVGIPELVRYLWIRVLATSVLAYVWNPAAPSDATYLKWQSITISSIPDGAITNSKIADAAVTDAKVNDVAASKITGLLTNAQLTLTTLGLVKVNAKALTAGVEANATAIPYDNTIPQNTEGTQIVSFAVTPLAQTAYLRIKFSAFATCAANTRATISLCQDAIANALCAVTSAVVAGYATSLTLDHLMVNPGGTITFQIRGGPEAAQDLFFNRATANELFGAIPKAWLIVEEYVLGSLS